VAFAPLEANMQHQPCGSATSRLQVKTRVRTTRLPIQYILFGGLGGSSLIRSGRNGEVAVSSGGRDFDDLGDEF